MASTTDRTLNHESLRCRIQGSVDHLYPSVVSYKGVPYGRLARRWTRPTPCTLGETFDARHYGPKCPQPEDLNNTADFGPYIPFPDCGTDELECLNLNVTAPIEVEAGGVPVPVPVLVWIHGGSLVFGANSDPIWEPSRLVSDSIEKRRPIIVVSINYRLGPFGFLAPDSCNMDDDQAPVGNFGFHDQYLALQWVQRHVAGFGGDPGRVTIAGESAGGCSVHAQVAYQEHLGGVTRLFHRAIMQSGNLAVMGFSSRKRVKELWDAAVEEAGEVRLSDVSSTELMAIPSLKMDGYGVMCDGVFVSSPLIGARGEFLPFAPTSLDAIMHGDNADEGNIFRSTARSTTTMCDLVRAATEVIGEKGCAELLIAYGLEEWARLDELERARRLCRFPEDARFYLPSDELQRAWPESSFYHLVAKSPCQGSLYPGDSFHTLDLLYLFGNFDEWLRKDGKEDDLRLGDRMRTAWLRFIYEDEPWEGASRGMSASFDTSGVTVGPMRQARGNDDDRRRRLAVLRQLGFENIVQIATRVFP